MLVAANIVLLLLSLGQVQVRVYRTHGPRNSASKQQNHVRVCYAGITPGPPVCVNALVCCPYLVRQVSRS